MLCPRVLVVLLSVCTRIDAVRSPAAAPDASPEARSSTLPTAPATADVDPYALYPTCQTCFSKECAHRDSCVRGKLRFKCPHLSHAPHVGASGAWQLGNKSFYYLDEGLAASLATFFGGGSHVIEFGAGLGCYTHVLRDNDIRVDAFDGAPLVAELSHGAVRMADLTNELLELPVADWVLSLEVAEHIPAAHEATFVRNVHRHNRNGVVISWAPTRAGHGHVNPRENKYVVDLFVQVVTPTQDQPPMMLKRQTLGGPRDAAVNGDEPPAHRRQLPARSQSLPDLGMCETLEITMSVRRPGSSATTQQLAERSQAPLFVLCKRLDFVFASLCRATRMTKKCRPSCERLRQACRGSRTQSWSSARIMRPSYRRSHSGYPLGGPERGLCCVHNFVLRRSR